MTPAQRIDRAAFVVFVVCLCLGIVSVACILAGVVLIGAGLVAFGCWLVLTFSGLFLLSVAGAVGAALLANAGAQWLK